VECQCSNLTTSRLELNAQRGELGKRHEIQLDDDVLKQSKNLREANVIAIIELLLGVG
jgi:hypothetical protein